MNKMQSRKPTANIANNQKGIVSLVVTILLMVVITIIVLSFSKISRRESRNAFDRQLSTQAFYASESGINDAVKVVNSWVKTNDSKLGNEYTSDCTTFAGDAGLSLPVNISGSPEAQYTCVFVDPSPPELVFNATDEQQIFPIQFKDNSDVSRLDITWDDGSGGTSFSCPAISTNPENFFSTCSAPILRLEIVDATNVGSAGKVFFLYPRSASGGNVITYATDVSGKAVQGYCTSGGTPNKCLTTVNLPAAKKAFFVRIKSIYKPAAFTIKGYTTGPLTPKEFKGAQAKIDVTGKAVDVLRRVQVRIAISELSSGLPRYGIQSVNVCKKFYIDGGDATDVGGCWGGVNPN